MKHRILVNVISVILCVLWQDLAAQTMRRQIVERGGNGPYAAEIVSDASFPEFTFYRPQDMQKAVMEEGRLPIVLYANGGCSYSNIEIRYFLSELASYGYLAAAIGPYTDEDFISHWKEVLSFMYPTGKQVILANGEEIAEPTEEEKDARYQAHMKQVKEDEAAGKEENVKTTYPRMLLEVLDWLIWQNENPDSEYYHKIDTDKVAAMGQSCGGVQALSVSVDPRVKTSVILNSGVGDLQMQGVDKEILANLHAPLFYLIGGPSDIAFPNAKKDFERIQGIPVVMINTTDGHEGTYYEENGGEYAVAVRKWLDWQLKGEIGQSALFLDEDYLHTLFPDWEMVKKNY
ncbi:MAG: hypothetical protein IJL91_04720 [Bacteroidales bacterium]|nr:hypothetical protein [Bacteroidales bacterium]